MREDGTYIEAGENDNLIVQKLQANPKALGSFGFSFLDQNTHKIQGSRVNGVEPTFESILFFQKVSVTEFFFGTDWSPQIALRADQVGDSGAFGAVPLFAGTMLVSLLAMLIAVPIGLMAAIYLSEYAHAKGRAIAARQGSAKREAGSRVAG